MAEDIQARLRAGVEAARQGNHAVARRHLQAVVVADPTNEAAWMWLAASSETLDDRRKCLRRVLQINPDNQNAQQALDQLDRVTGTRQQPQRDRQGVIPVWIQVLGAFSGIVILVIIIISLVNAAAGGPNQANTDRTAQAVVESVVNATETPTPTITLTPTLPGIIVSPENAPTLPPTFTPTQAPTATATLEPTVTPFPLNTFRLYYVGLNPGEGQSQLFQSQGDGSGEQTVNLNTSLYAISPDGRQIAFVQTVEEDVVEPVEEEQDPTDIPEEENIEPAEEEGDAAEEASIPAEPTAQPTIVNTGLTLGGDGAVALFVAPINSPGDAERVLPSAARSLSRPAWSPDGTQIVYVRDGNILEVVRVRGTADDGPGSLNTLLDSQTGQKTDPAWSPDGSQIVYAGDQLSPGFLEIYAYQFSDEAVEQLTNDIGNSFAPVWSPDGTRVAFVSDRGGDGDIYIMDADGSRPFLLTFDDSGAEDRSPSFSPDGRWVAFSSNRLGNSFDIFVVDLQGDVLEQITENNRTNGAPAFVPTS